MCTETLQGALFCISDPSPVGTSQDLSSIITRFSPDSLSAAVGEEECWEGDDKVDSSAAARLPSPEAGASAKWPTCRPCELCPEVIGKHKVLWCLCQVGQHFCTETENNSTADGAHWNISGISSVLVCVKHVKSIDSIDFLQV